MTAFLEPFTRLSNGVTNVGFYNRISAPNGVTGETFETEFLLLQAYPSPELEERIESGPWVQCDSKDCLDAARATILQLQVHPAPGEGLWRYPLLHSGIPYELGEIWVVAPEDTETFQAEVAAFIDGGNPVTYTLTGGPYQGVELRFKRYAV